MARFLKFKFQTILKFNFNGSQFYLKKIWLFQKIVNFADVHIKLKIKNGEHLR